MKNKQEFLHVLRDKPRQYKKIAILRANALGDFIFSLPACQALREMLPNAQIVLLAKKWHTYFLSQRPSPFNKVIEIPRFPGIGEKENIIPNKIEIKKFFNLMQNEHFDLAIQLHGGGHFSNSFILKLKANTTIGTQTEDADLLSSHIPYHYYQNEYMRWLEVVSLIGAKASMPMPHITVTIEDIQEARRNLQGDTDKIIVIHPGASDIKRRWLTDRFAKVADYFAHKGYRIIVTGTGNEKNLITQVLQKMNYSAENFYNRVSLNGLTGLLNLSKLVIANDTGPLHLATAVGTPTVGLYWCANMINGSSPFKSKNIALSSWKIHCPLCKSNCASYYPFDSKMAQCSHNVSFISEITVSDVIHAANSLLNEG